MRVAQYHAQPLTLNTARVIETLGHNCAYTVPQNLRAGLPLFFTCLFCSPWCQAIYGDNQGLLALVHLVQGNLLFTPLCSPTWCWVILPPDACNEETKCDITPILEWDQDYNYIADGLITFCNISSHFQLKWTKSSIYFEPNPLLTKKPIFDPFCGKRSQIYKRDPEPAPFWSLHGAQIRGILVFPVIKITGGSSGVYVTCIYCSLNVKITSIKCTRSWRHLLCVCFSVCGRQKPECITNLSPVADDAITQGGIRGLGSPLASLVYLCKRWTFYFFVFL